MPSAIPVETSRERPAWGSGALREELSIACKGTSGGGRGSGAQGSMPSGGQLRASPGAPDAEGTAGARGVTCCMGAGRGSPGIQKSENKW